MITLKKHIPNTLTLLNLLAGCIGTVCALDGALGITFWMLLASLAFDFLDGFTARLLKAYSPMGKELDSLADMVSFGVVPSAVCYTLGVGWFGFVIALFSALRLAKFNIDTRQSDQFIGMPTPANALFFVSIGFIVYNRLCPWMAHLLLYEWVLGTLIVLFSLLLVSEVPMFALKFKDYSLKKNRFVSGFLLASLAAIVLLGVPALPFIVLAYALYSIVRHTPNVHSLKELF